MKSVAIVDCANPLPSVSVTVSVNISIPLTFSLSHCHFNPLMFIFCNTFLISFSPPFSQLLSFFHSLSNPNSFTLESFWFIPTPTQQPPKPLQSRPTPQTSSPLTSDFQLTSIYVAYSKNRIYIMENNMWQPCKLLVDWQKGGVVRKHHLPLFSSLVVLQTFSFRVFLIEVFQCPRGLRVIQDTRSRQ